jgi:hypothetical protein
MSHSFDVVTESSASVEEIHATVAVGCFTTTWIAEHA